MNVLHYRSFRDPETVRIENLLAIAKSQECPARLTGSARKRMVKLMNFKPEEEWDDTDRIFMNYCEYTRNKRNSHFEKLFGPKKEKRENDEKPPGESVIAAAVPEADIDIEMEVRMEQSVEQLLSPQEDAFEGSSVAPETDSPAPETTTEAPVVPSETQIPTDA